jgi:hypothetical protein
MPEQMRSTTTNPEAMKLAIRWMRGQAETSDVRRALSIKSSAQAIYKMGSLLRSAYEQGMCRVQLVRDGKAEE